MKKQFFAALTLVAALLGSVVAAIGADLAFPIHVTAIEIDGNAEVKTRDVAEALPLKVGDVLAAYADLQPTSQAILDLGWFSEVLPELTQEGVVTFRVTENPVVKKIVITGNTHTKPIEVFGVRLFSVRIMPTWKIRQKLRENDVRTGETLNSNDLTDALLDVVQEYKESGYPLVMIGDVKVGPTVSIEVIEGRVAASRVAGLVTVPTEVAEAIVSLPTDEVLTQKELNAVALGLQQSVYFSGMDFAAVAGPTRDSVILNWQLTERMILQTPSSVRAIALEGVAQFPEDVVAREVGPLPDGLVDNYAVLRALEGVYQLYTHGGFVMARFSDPRIDGDTLRLRVEEGIVSEIALHGTETQRLVLEKTLQIGVGRVLTRNDLAVTQQRLAALGYFDNIVVDPKWTESGLQVSVSVRDKSTLGGLNGSLAFEPATGGLVGELSVSQRNLFGTGQDVSLTYKRGVTAEGDPDESTWEVGYSTLAPQTEFDRISLNLYRTTEQVAADGEGAADTYLTIGGRVQFDYPIGNYSDFTIGYRHDLERKLSETDWSPVDAVAFSIQEDSTDDILFPTRGLRQSASLEKAGGFAVGKEYTKVDLVWTRFVALYDDLFFGLDHVLAFRLKGGLGDAGVTGSEMYQLGGPTTVRGADSAHVRRMAVANVEHRLELTDGFILTAFLDAGVDLEQISWDSIVATTGLELGISAAGVYVRLDMAWRLGADGSWTPKFDIGFGPMF